MAKFSDSLQSQLQAVKGVVQYTNKDALCISAFVNKKLSRRANKKVSQ